MTAARREGRQGTASSDFKLGASRAPVCSAPAHDNTASLCLPLRGWSGFLTQGGSSPGVRGRLDGQSDSTLPGERSPDGPAKPWTQRVLQLREWGPQTDTEPTGHPGDERSPGGRGDNPVPGVPGLGFGWGAGQRSNSMPRTSAAQVDLGANPDPRAPASPGVGRRRPDRRADSTPPRMRKPGGHRGQKPWARGGPAAWG